MIKNFSDKNTEKLWWGEQLKKPSEELQRSARRKLLIIDAALNLQDLKVPPNNQLEKLKGDRKKQYSIRINNQRRICFNWHNNKASNVEIVDYH